MLCNIKVVKIHARFHLSQFYRYGENMSSNDKKTSAGVASLAGETLQNPNASKIQKSLAGSALAQSGSSKQTGSAMETTASKALQSDKYSETTKKLAGSVLSQSKK